MDIVNGEVKTVDLAKGAVTNKKFASNAVTGAKLDEGTLSRADAASHPQRNIVTRALGIDDKVMVDSFELMAVTGDRYLICSDGLFNEVPQSEIVATLQRSRQRARYRRDLARLRRTSPHLIDDIGLSQAAADRAATTPFWRL